MAGISANNPFKRQTCHRDKCPFKATGQDCKDTCYKSGIIYTATCSLCHEDTSQAVYVGESSRSIFTRANQHLADFSRARRTQGDQDQGQRPSNFYMDHLSEQHPDQIDAVDPKTGIRWSVIDTHRDPLSRQTMEAVYIQQALTSKSVQGLPGVQVHSMNRKGEYFSARERWTRD